VDLLVDLGNSRAHLAVGRPDGALVALGACDHADGAAGWERLLGPRLEAQPPTRVAVVDVNPPARDALCAWARERLSAEPRVLGLDLPCALQLSVAAPEQVGRDRLANGLWAARTFPGEAVAVLDLGTAITLDVVSADGAFLGGVIACGIGSQARALDEFTAGLPRVRPLDGAPSVLGGTTVACIEAGLTWSAVGLVETLCARLTDELGATPRVMATGGDAQRIAPLCRSIERVVPSLTLEGLALALREAGP
jgi:type III pantothenate kinase